MTRIEELLARSAAGTETVEKVTAELAAVVLLLNGVARDDTQYILDTFNAKRTKETADLFAGREPIVDAYDRLIV